MASAKIVGSFQIDTAGNRTTDEVIAAGNYDGKNDLVNGKNFPMRPMPKSPREIVFMEFDDYLFSGEVLAEAKRQGLECPWHEDALFFGEQYPEEQCKTQIVFLHEPWLDPFNFLLVLLLDYYGERRSIDLYYAGGKWSRKCRFAFVKP